MRSQIEFVEDRDTDQGWARFPKSMEMFANFFGNVTYIMAVRPLQRLKRLDVFQFLGKGLEDGQIGWTLQIKHPSGLLC